MSRNIDDIIVSEISKEAVQPFYAVELFFDSGDLRFWTGQGDREIGGQTYIGTGGLLTIGDVDETKDLTANSLSLTMDGLNASIISLALQEPYQGRVGRLLYGMEVTYPSDWILATGLWNDSGVWDDASYWRDSTAPMYATTEIFSGLMDVMTIVHSGETATVNIVLESKLVMLKRPNIRRYTSANHKLRHPTDTFFDYVQSLQDMEVAWGRTVQGSGIT